MSNIKLRGKLQAIKDERANSENGFNDELKEIAAAALGLVPGPGSVLSMLVGLFWPSGGINLEAFFDRIKEWVKDYVEWRLVQEQIQNANNLINGYRRNLEDANKLTGQDKLNLMTSLHGDINTHADFFLTQNNYSNIHLLTTFTPMAVMHIALLSEIVKLAQEMDNPNADNWYKILEDRSQEYAAGGRKAVDHVVSWRRAQIEITLRSVHHPMWGYIPYLRWHDKFLNKTHYDNVFDWDKYITAIQEAAALQERCRAHFNKYVVDVVGQWDDKGRGILPGEDTTRAADEAANARILQDHEAHVRELQAKHASASKGQPTATQP